jgi:hypothetical protein
MRIYHLIWLFIIGFSCKERTENFHGSSLTLNKIDSIYFELDSFSTSRNLSSQLISTDTSTLFSFLNSKNNSIYFYNLNSGKMENKLAFDVQGKSGVGRISSYLFNSMDSIFLYSYGRARLYLVNSKNEILNSYFVDGDQMSVRPEVNSTRPLFTINDELIFNSWGSQKEYYNNNSFAENAFMFLNISNSEKKYRISYPDAYKGAIWGVQLFQIYHDFNYKDRLLVLSFSADNDLTAYDVRSGKYKRIKVNGIQDLSVQPLSYSSEKISPDISEEVKHQMGQTYYSFIKFDSINNIYVRVINHKFDDRFIEKFSGLESVFGGYSLLVLDREFNFLDQIQLPEGNYYLGSMFFWKGKLYLEKIQNYDEDILVFDVFVFNGL